MSSIASKHNITFSPSRAAPRPPCRTQAHDELPADHPFLNPYTPFTPPRQTHTPEHLSRTRSSSTLASDYTLRTPPLSPTYQPRSVPSNHASPSSPNWKSRVCSASKTWLAAPLSASQRDHLGHSIISRPRPCGVETAQLFAPAPRAQPFIPVPAELSILDSRVHGGLVGDIEYITGKKLRMPFFSRRKGSKEGKKLCEVRSPSNDSEKTLSNRLIKERRMSEEEQLLLEAWVPSANEKLVGRRGRGVREGNWI